MTKIVSASHAFTEREWFLVLRGEPRNFEPVFHIKAFDTKEDAEKAEWTANELLVPGSMRVVHRKEFLGSACKLAADHMMTIQVYAHLDSRMIFPIRLVPIDSDTVEIVLPESADA